MDQKPKSFGPAFPLSLVTTLGDPIREQAMRVDVPRVMRLAERLTGLKDYGDDTGDFERRLEETVEALLQTDWNILGRFGLKYVLHWHLSNRLRLVELFKQHPEIMETPVERPLVITGLFRTGTTFLYNVLAADPRHRTARMWEVCYPVGRTKNLLDDDKWQRWRGGHLVAMDHFIIPEQDEVHYVTTDAYEEDYFLLENDLAILTFSVGMGAFPYAMRMLEWDMVEPYRWHKRQLQVLWQREAAERWLLKAPWHLWNLEGLLAVYPDAQVIHTHRDVVGAIGSQCSLSARIAGKFQRNFDPNEIGRFWVEYSRLGLERGLQARSALPDSQLYDVRLKELRAQPLEVVEDIYKRFDLPFDDELAERLRVRIAEEPTAQHGEHDYDIADYGLTESQIEAAFDDYRTRFGV